MPPAHSPLEEPGLGLIDTRNSSIDASLRTSLLHVEYRDARLRTRFHTQPGVELHLTLAGRALFHVAGRNHLQTPRQGLVFRGHNPHQFIADPALPFQRTVICFDPADYAIAVRGDPLLTLDWLPPEGCFPFELSEQDFNRADELARWLRYEVNFQLQDWRETATGLLLNLLALVRRNGTAGRPTPSQTSTNGRRGDLTNYVCTHLRQNLAGDLGLQSVARLFKVSPEHLTRSFRRQLGISFHRYVLVERVTAAKELLRAQPQKSITDIAFSTGFESSGQFGKVFKKHTRLTPTQFRAAEA